MRRQRPVSTPSRIFLPHPSTTSTTKRSRIHAFELSKLTLLGAFPLILQGLTFWLYHICSSGKVVIDADDRVFILAVPQPAGEKNWKKVTEDASTALDNAAKEIFGPNYDQEVPTSYSRRGPHLTEHMGLGMGGGQQEPTPFAMHDSVGKICAALFMKAAILRLLGFANCACFLRSNILNF